MTIDTLKLNGSLSVFCDIVLRNEKIWSIDQLFDNYLIYLNQDSRAVTPKEISVKENTEFAKVYLAKRLSSHQRNENNLIIQTAYSHQGKDIISDIRYGWRVNKNQSAQRMKSNELPPIQYAFTVSHANQYIPAMGYYNNLLELLNAVSTSHIELCTRQFS